MSIIETEKETQQNRSAQNSTEDAVWFLASKGKLGKWIIDRWADADDIASGAVFVGSCAKAMVRAQLFPLHEIDQKTVTTDGIFVPTMREKVASGAMAGAGIGVFVTGVITKSNEYYYQRPKEAALPIIFGTILSSIAGGVSAAAAHRYLKV